MYKLLQLKLIFLTKNIYFWLITFLLFFSNIIYLVLNIYVFKDFTENGVRIFQSSHSYLLTFIPVFGSIVFSIIFAWLTLFYNNGTVLELTLGATNVSQKLIKWSNLLMYLVLISIYEMINFYIYFQFSILEEAATFQSSFLYAFKNSILQYLIIIIVAISFVSLSSIFNKEKWNIVSTSILIFISFISIVGVKTYKPEMGIEINGEWFISDFDKTESYYEDVVTNKRYKIVKMNENYGEKGESYIKNYEFSFSRDVISFFDINALYASTLFDKENYGTNLNSFSPKKMIIKKQEIDSYIVVGEDKYYYQLEEDDVYKYYHDLFKLRFDNWLTKSNNFNSLSLHDRLSMLEKNFNSIIDNSFTSWNATIIQGEYEKFNKYTFDFYQYIQKVYINRSKILNNAQQMNYTSDDLWVIDGLNQVNKYTYVIEYKNICSNLNWIFWILLPSIMLSINIYITKKRGV